ncbi:hypothetical protein SDC9_148162 [bioreactor metagenome]|uniref:HTH cro/C1-type domain-containing protein n=1 Tax=bioreactor metagenome TaxID=1076179 RepID=A0A645EJR8_9ZZZZ
MQNLKILRENAGLSQEKLASQLGVAQQSIHSYEHGIYEPDIATLKRISAFFDTSVDYLIGNTDIPYKIVRTDQYDLNEEEAEIMRKYRSLTAKNRESLRLILDSLL